MPNSTTTTAKDVLMSVASPQSASYSITAASPQTQGSKTGAEGDGDEWQAVQLLLQDAQFMGGDVAALHGRWTMLLHDITDVLHHALAPSF
jgi:hypothetical protein